MLPQQHSVVIENPDFQGTSNQDHPLFLMIPLFARRRILFFFSPAFSAKPYKPEIDVFSLLRKYAESKKI
ncbi:MAG: hypothetical protein JEY71_02370 [Sphaerochaeta sp.]|nr:hypothetical protein [Sphaerochaeta sp.]